MKLRVLDLFSGIGGFSLGLHWAGGFETVGFCEIEEYPRKVLELRFPGVPIFNDIRSLTGEQIKEQCGTVDVVCGGFPCQDLSCAGKQAGIDHGERSSLYREMLRIISECGPKYAIFENVTALLTGDRGRWFAKFLYDLAEIGFDAEWHCLPASSIGLPHERDRIWIIANPNSFGLEAYRDGRCRKQILSSWPSKKNNCSDAVERFWETSSSTNRRGYVIPNRVDRLKCLGNAVVPQVVEVIGRAIMEVENGR